MPYFYFNLNKIVWRLLPCLVISTMLLLLLSGCNKKNSDQSLFTRQDTTQTNIKFVNKLDESGKLNILEYLYFYNGAGVAAGDINNDGLPDLFFVSNQGKNKLFLNKGNFSFQDISTTSGIEGFSEWKTGVTMADVNGDGYLDIYVCAVANFMGLEGANELYINNGDLTFTEKAATYGLDFSGFSTQAAFFDYDKDGDLDVYLLNHAIHTARSYDRVSTRSLKNNEAGDYLFQNQLISNHTDGKPVTKFKDVSAEAGIYQASMGYGLGIGVADINNDGWDDIYVSNDFHEDDYYYINNGDGTFREDVKNHFKHLSRFSMGCDIADVNNDGYFDIMTLDMYPEDENIEKSSMGEDPFDIFIYKLQFGYFNQYSRNCLQLSNSGEKFSDIAALAGVAATDWSWGTLIADYDNDGWKDIFISNGIVRRPNNLDYIKFATSDSMTYMENVPKSFNDRAIGLMPEGKIHNYFFKGTPHLKFDDKSLDWGFQEPTISNGVSYADLDNDGDLDIVTNNINDQAGVYKNNSETNFDNHYLKIKLEGGKLNKNGIGAKAYIKHKGQLLVQQLMPTRGFQSSVEPLLNFGLGKIEHIDTVVIVWPSQRVQLITNCKTDTLLVFNENAATNDAGALFNKFYKRISPIFEAQAQLPFDYTHKENLFYDFYREALMPFQVSSEGPCLAVGDVNKDGLDDFFIGGAKWQPGHLFVQQTNGGFTKSNMEVFQADSIYEDVDAIFFDADNDNDLDLYVVNGGNEFADEAPQQFDRLYINEGDLKFTRSNGLPNMFSNKSCVVAGDIDLDGDLDLFVGGRVKPNQYGQTPESFLLINDGRGNFMDQTKNWSATLKQAGMVTDAQWFDYDKDGDLDLVLCGEWMPIKIFENKNKQLIAFHTKGLKNSYGLWQTIEVADFDNDGDLDLVAGNLGTNTKLRKQDGSSLKLFVKDIDKNGTNEHILSYNRNDKWFPVSTKDEIGKHLPLMSKKFTTYQNYAGKTIDELFDKNELKDALELKVTMFESVYIENLGNQEFTLHPLPVEAQFSKIYSFHIEDVDQDKNLDIILGGNQYGVSTYQGRYDASYGLILKGNGSGNFKSMIPTATGLVLDGEVRDIKPITINNKEMLLIARNGQAVQLFKKLKPIKK